MSAILWLEGNCFKQFSTVSNRPSLPKTWNYKAFLYYFLQTIRLPSSKQYSPFLLKLINLIFCYILVLKTLWMVFFVKHAEMFLLDQQQAPGSECQGRTSSPGEPLAFAAAKVHPVLRLLCFCLAGALSLQTTFWLWNCD